METRTIVGATVAVMLFGGAISTPANADTLAAPGGRASGAAPSRDSVALLAAQAEGVAELPRVSGSVEMTFEPLSPTSGRVQVWSDGALRLNQVVVDDSGADDATLHARATYTRGDWWGNLNTCLSNAGIPAWIVGGLSIACGVACAITAGVGCGVCLAAAIGGWSGTVTGCVAVANKYS